METRHDVCRSSAFRKHACRNRNLHPSM